MAPDLTDLYYIPRKNSLWLSFLVVSILYVVDLSPSIYLHGRWGWVAGSALVGIIALYFLGEKKHFVFSSRSLEVWLRRTWFGIPLSRWQAKGKAIRFILSRLSLYQGPDCFRLSIETNEGDFRLATFMNSRLARRDAQRLKELTQWRCTFDDVKPGLIEESFDLLIVAFFVLGMYALAFALLIRLFNHFTQSHLPYSSWLWPWTLLTIYAAYQSDFLGYLRSIPKRWHSTVKFLAGTLRDFPFAYLGCGILSACFIAQAFVPLDDRQASGFFGRLFQKYSAPDLATLGGFSPILVLQFHRWHSLVLASLLHADVIHCLMNLVTFSFVTIGISLFDFEKTPWSRSVTQAAIFILCAIGAELLTLLVPGRTAVSVGASAGILGLAAYGLVVITAPHPESRLKHWGIGLFVLIFLTLLPPRHGSWSQLDHAGHLSGIFLGTVLGFLLLSRPVASRFENSVVRAAAVISSAYLVAVILSAGRIAWDVFPHGF
jgi:membrane associated rhomboid family serine protease